MTGITDHKQSGNVLLWRAVLYFEYDVRKLSYVNSVNAVPVDSHRVITTAVVDLKEQPQTTNLLEIVQLFVKHFGDQQIPCIEYGDRCLCISQGIFVIPKPQVTVSYHVNIY